MDLDGDGVIDGKDAQIALEIAKKQAAEYLAMAESEGFFSHFAAYNEQILRPLKNAGEFSTEGAKKEILATLMLQPRDLRNGFVLYNVLAFLFGVAEAFTSMALGHGPWSLIWNGGAGYCIAYTLYWIFLCKQAKALCFYGLCFLALYILFNAYMCFWSFTNFKLIGSTLYGCKGFIDVLQVTCAYAIYKSLDGEGPSPMF